MRRKKINVAVISTALLIFAIVIWFLHTDKFTFTPASISSPPQQNNVIFISVDTLRADHLGIYGYDRNTSPNIDNFAQDNILFKQAITQGTLSLTSYASIFTSQYQEVHGTHGGGKERISKGLGSSALTMAEVFKAQGYKTAAFVGELHLEPKYGFDQGFDVYNSKGFSFNDSMPSAVKWLKENKNKNFFLFLQGYDAHDPYEAPEPFWHMFDPGYEGVLHDLPFHDLDFGYRSQLSIKDGNPAVKIGAEVIPLAQRDIDHVIAHYDGEIRYADYLVGQFLGTLREMGLYDDSIIVIFSDHGEMIGDNINRPEGKTVRMTGHWVVTEEVIRVLLALKPSTAESKTVLAQAQLIDIFPTLLDFLHILPSKDLKKRIQGRSLVPAIKGNAGVDFNKYTYGNTPGRKFVRTPRWKLIHRAGASRLYDLKNDPGETKNVRDQYPDVFEQLEEKLIEWNFVNLKKKLELAQHINSVVL